LHPAPLTISFALWQNTSIPQAFLEEIYRPVDPDKGGSASKSLEKYLSIWAESQSKPLVLLIDEVDSLYDDILVSFLQ